MSGDEPLVRVTERAAQRIRELAASDPLGETGVLRIGIQGGGCSGFEYALSFDHGPREGDAEIELHGTRVVIDPASAPYLVEAEIDYVTGLTDAGFAINNPNVVAACGCGSSFQAKEGVGG